MQNVSLLIKGLCKGVSWIFIFKDHAYPLHITVSIKSTKLDIRNIFRGSVIAKIVGNNVKSNSSFDDVVNMYVYEEQVDGRNLSEIINTEHENVKYLPGHKLPANVVCYSPYTQTILFVIVNFERKCFMIIFQVAVTDVVEAAKDADVLVFVVPHQFVARLCGGLKGKLKQGASAISLIKVRPSFLEIIYNIRITSIE